MLAICLNAKWLISTHSETRGGLENISKDLERPNEPPAEFPQQLQSAPVASASGIKYFKVRERSRRRKPIPFPLAGGFDYRNHESRFREAGDKRQQGIQADIQRQCREWVAVKSMEDSNDG